MEYIVYSGKVRRQFKLVGNFSTFSNNAERTDVTWGQLAFDTESLGSLQRSNPKVSLLVQIVAFLPMMTIIVAFLTRLGCFQLIMNNANLLFCFIDHSRSKELSFTGFLPVKGCLTSSSIEEFKGSHVQTRLENIVISKFGEWKRFLPILSKRDNTSSEHVFQDLINPFNLTARLRVESCTKGEMSSHTILKTLPKSRGEKATTIRIDLQRNTMKRHNSRDIQVR